jgi:hypothetical protein
MTELSSLSFSSPNFGASGSVDGKTLTIALSGNADLGALAPLEKVLASLHQEAETAAVAEVAVDLRKLEFMNSSCFKNFVSWIGKVQELDGTKQYRIRFVSNAEILWQRRSLHALQCFAAQLITVET